MKIEDAWAEVQFRCPSLVGAEICRDVSVEHDGTTVRVRWVEPSFVGPFEMETVLNLSVFVAEPEQSQNEAHRCTNSELS